MAFTGWVSVGYAGSVPVKPSPEVPPWIKAANPRGVSDNMTTSGKEFRTGGLAPRVLDNNTKIDS